jgi:hypothetical protein
VLTGGEDRVAVGVDSGGRRDAVLEAATVDRDLGAGPLQVGQVADERGGPGCQPLLEHRTRGGAGTCGHGLPLRVELRAAVEAAGVVDADLGVA